MNRSSSLRAFALLAKAAFARELRRGPLRPVLEHLVAPVAAVWFLTFLHTEITAHDGWPLLAVGATVWLLFANALTRGGMVIWHERPLVEGIAVPPWILVTSATLVPLVVFVVQVAITGTAIVVTSTGYDAPGAALVVPAAIAVGSGLGLGILCARMCLVRARFARVVPLVVVASVLLTPVLYPLSALGDDADAWCTVDPLCSAVELARADIADAPAPVPDAAPVVAAVAATALLVWGLLAIRRPRRSTDPVDPSGPALRLTGVTSGPAPPAGRHRAGRILGDLAGALTVRRGATLPATGPPFVTDVDLEVARGEVVGVIGGPDAGRRGLLAIAAGQARPTRGTVTTPGGAVGLVHLRSGVHSSLGLRDNLVLRSLVDGGPADTAGAAADSVLRFGELEDLVATPARRVGDEVLVRLAAATSVCSGRPVVVWDDDLLGTVPAFRQRCLGVVPSILAAGRSLLLGTGDLGKVGEIAPRCVWLDGGRVRFDGPTPEALDRRLAPRADPRPAGDLEAGDGCRIVGVHLLDGRGAPASAYLPGDPVVVSVDLECAEPIESPYAVIGLAGASGPITAASMFLDGHRPATLEGRTTIGCRFEGPTLSPRHTFTVRFALYASDATTVVVPKQVVASFVTGGSAAECGLTGERAAGRVLGAAPVLGDYTWLLP